MIPCSGKKQIILIIVHYYLPGYKSGGPVRTIENLVEQIGDDFDFRIITSDRDMLDQAPYSNVQVNGWNRVGKAEVYYLSSDQCSLRGLAKLINTIPYDVLYLNSFFDPVFSVDLLVAWRLGWLPNRPMVIAPRGEFSSAALAIKRWKKVLYLVTAQVFGFYRNVVWQASSEGEAVDIRKVLGRKNAQYIVIAPNLPAAVQDARIGIIPTQGENETLRVVFLSRITPMKNLDFALRVLAKVSMPVVLHIFGIIDDCAYWKTCQELIHALPCHVVASYHGAVDHELVHETLSGYDLFFLPTRGENYGHVIFEALAAGVPVLISDQTPWRDLDQEAVGYMRSLNDENEFVKVIEQHYRLSVYERKEQSVKAHAYAQKIAEDSNLVEKNRALFMNLL